MSTTILGVWITNQVIFWGVVNGLIFGLLAMGIVLIYRSTRVINFAVGNMGLPGAALFALMMINWGFPFWIALISCLLIGALIGAVVELVIVKRLFHRPRVVLLIATVGIADLMRAIVVLAYPDIEGTQTSYPVAIGTIWEDSVSWLTALTTWIPGVADDEGLRIIGANVQILIAVPLVALVLGLLVSKTVFGKAITASADNVDLSRLSGVNPHVVSTVVWTIGGFLATLSIILLSGGSAATGIENLGPYTLTNALAAAVIAGMRSFPRAMIGGIAIGIAQNLFNFNFTRDPGLGTLLVFVAVVVALYWQSRNDDEAVLAFAPKVRPLPLWARDIWWIRNMHRIAMGIGLLIVIIIAWRHVEIFGWINDNQSFWEAPEKIKQSQFLLYSSIVGIAICVASLTVITGWSGQLSLAQMAYAGIGALSAAAFNRGIELDIGYGDTRLIDFEWPGIPTIPAIIAAVFFTAAVAAITGVGALRVRGLMLAVSTFAFAIAAEQYLYGRPFLSNGERSVLFDRGYLFGWFLKDQRSYFYFTLACLVVVVAVLGRLRRSGFGRSVIAVRDNADTASAYTVSPVRMKLMAFAVAGGVAGLGGALLGNLVRQIRFNEALFRIGDSLETVNMVVIGGLGSITGPLLGALWIEGLPKFFPDQPVIGLVTSSMGFLFVLMYFPGGFVQIAYTTRNTLIGVVERRRASEISGESTTRPPVALQDRIRRDPRQLATPPSDLARLGGYGIAVIKALVSAVIAVLAIPQLFSGDSYGWGIALLAVAASGFWSARLLYSLASAPTRIVGSARQKTLYTLLLLFELPPVPFMWPFFVRNWLPSERRLASAARVNEASPSGSNADDLVLRTHDITVNFGGNIAVDHVDIDVHRDEIVGLIGTNGAGKSTFMNAVGGYVPSVGTVELIGLDISDLSPPRRSSEGLGRTFQAATLFPELTVRESVQVALEARERSSFIKSALFLNGPAERRKRSDADDLIDFLGLGRYADSFISDLSTGTRRIVELAGLLAVDAELLCLDEPTAGIAQRETEAFGPLIVEIRKELGASMLIIEHDMPLIMSISDRVYCLESGAVIASGEPETVRNNPAVVASYLGTDDRAIERSDQ
ncbi:MAG: ATP-binding cassette domain-containing protein [Acidimicrobiaceae bacterium]|nr:ATP-binding cassette domain-containing protein [Acidimicrobiaceae bacterium]